MRVAVIGCGLIGSMRARAVAAVRDLELALICDVDPDRATALAKKHSCEASSDWPSAVARPDIPLVIVSTPNHLHAPIAMAAMEAGKHVLCEKPLGRTLEECRALVECAARNKITLKTGFNHRYYPSVLKAKELVDGGAIGEALFFRGWIGHHGGPDFMTRWPCDAQVSGGGTFMDNGVHLLDLARHFLGEVEEVQGYVATSLWDVSPCEDNGIALLRFRGGKLASIMSSWTQWKGYFHVEVYGTNGYINAEYPPMKTTLGTLAHAGSAARGRIFHFPTERLLEKLLSFRRTTVRTFALEMEEWAEAIKGNRDPEGNGYDGLRAVEMVCGIYESSRRGMRVPL